MPNTPVRETVAALRDRPSAEVLIIGAGINGLATFRDLALQGVDVAIVDRADFASGATAASSHMIHGGVRYLENGELRLVKESVTERNGLLKTAPHLVKPLPTVIPIFSTFSGLISAPLRMLRHGSAASKPRGALLIKTGLMIYDAFSRDGGSVPRHVFRGRTASLAEYPQLPDSVRYTATYYDASVHEPERLALDVLHDGLVAGGRAANYVSSVGAHGEGAVLRDEETGDEFTFTAKVVINASGPWTDLTNEALGTQTTYMGGTKGSHIVLHHPELLAATRGREIFFEHTDGRIVLIYPFPDRVMVGTTDLEADPREPAVCTDEEIDYFIELVAHVFPNIVVDRSHIVYSMSGIRPLPTHGDLAPGFVSRDYRIVEGALGAATLFSIVGGKLTTFRALGEHVADKALAALGRDRRTSTAKRAIGGGAGFPHNEGERRVWMQRWRDHCGTERALALLERYGTSAERLLGGLGEAETFLDTAAGYSREEIRWLVAEQQAVHLLDVVQRRTSLAMAGKVSEAVLVELAEAMGSVLGWSTEQERDEVREAARHLRETHRSPLDAVTPGRAG